MKKLVSVLLAVTMVFGIMLFVPTAAEAADASSYIGTQKTLTIAYYNASGKASKYTVNVPRIKLSTQDAQTINNYLLDFCTYQKGRYDAAYGNKKKVTPKFGCKSYLNSNVLTVSVISGNPDIKTNSGWTFKINVKTGKRLQNKDVLALKGVSLSAANKKMIECVKKDLDSGTSAGQAYFAKHGYSYYKSIEDEIANCTSYYLDNSGNLCASFYNAWEIDGQYVGYWLFGAKIASSSSSSVYPKVTKLENIDGGIRIKWNKVSGAAKYRLFYMTSSGWKRFGTDGTPNTCVINSLNSGRKYTFTVRAVNSKGKYVGTYYKKGYTITYIDAPAIPTLQNTRSGIKVGWKKVTGAVKYRVFRKTLNGGWKKLADTTGSSYLDKSAKNNVTYSYTIRCVSADGKKFTSGYKAKGRSISCRR